MYDANKSNPRYTKNKVYLPVVYCKNIVFPICGRRIAVLDWYEEQVCLRGQPLQQTFVQHAERPNQAVNDGALNTAVRQTQPVEKSNNSLWSLASPNLEEFQRALDKSLEELERIPATIEQQQSRRARHGYHVEPQKQFEATTQEPMLC